MKILDVLNSPWAIVPEKLHEITEVYARHVRGEKIDVKSLRAQMDAAIQIQTGEAKPSRPYQVIDGVAVLGLEGVIAKKMNLFSMISGGLSTQLFARDFNQARRDPDVHSIVLAIDSPGGTVDGTQELARVIMDARGGDKPVVAWVDGMMASAAYWIGSAADSVYIGADTDWVGSIGVVTQHVDYSRYEDRVGIKTTEIYAGKYKRIASESKPLSEEGQAYLQGQVDYLYSVFVDAVATQRDVPVDQVVENMADGQIFIGQQAIFAGLVDGASTLDALIGQLAAGAYVARRQPGAESDPREKAGADSDPRRQASADSVSRRQASAVAPAAAITSDAGGASGSTTDNEDTMDITRETIERDHPEIAAALREEGVAAGATAERERILAVEAQLLPGHEKLIAALKADGKTTGAEAAVQILAAEKAAGAAKAQALAEDAPQPVGAAASATGAPAGEADLSPEEKAEKKWNSDATLRAEFGDNKAAYLAFLKAESTGKVRVLSRAAG